MPLIQPPPRERLSAPSASSGLHGGVGVGAGVGVYVCVCVCVSVCVCIFVGGTILCLSYLKVHIAFTM